jgi:hypothetical protein
LRKLYLNQTIVTDGGLAQLKNLKDLEEIGLEGTLAQGQGLLGSNPNLRILHR